MKQSTMKLTIKILGILFMLIGIAFLIEPEGVYRWGEDNSGDIKFYISVIVLRLVFWGVLILAAKDSKHPSVIKFIGYLAIIAAIFLIVIGHQGFQDIISTLIPIFKPYASVSGLTGIAIGGFLIYAFSRKSTFN